MDHRPLIGVVIATYGDRDRWAPLVQRASLSVDRQTFAPCGRVWVHGHSLAGARNEGATKLGSERPLGTDRADHIVFLDADDELDPGYLEAMAAALTAHTGRAAIFRPNTIGIHEGGVEDPAPRMIPRTDMRHKNCCVIGTMVPAVEFADVRGFDWYPTLEDWALFRKLLASGAEMVDVPDAIYRIHVRPKSRNAPSVDMTETYRRIRKDIPL